MAQQLERTYPFFKVRPLSLCFLLIFLVVTFPLLVYPLILLLVKASSYVVSGKFEYGPLMLSSLKFSLLQASISTILSALVGTSLAFFLMENGKGTKSWVWILGLLSFSMPSLVIVLTLLSFWGSEGLGLSLFGWKGILLCHVAMNYPLFMKFIGEAWLANSTEMEMTGLSLGLNRIQLFLHVTLPKIRSALFSALLLSFTYCFCSFIPVALLGGDPKLSTFELNIYQALKFENNFEKAAVLAVVQLLMLFPLFLLFKKISQGVVSASHSERINIYKLSKTTKIVVGFVFAVGLFFLTYGPFGLLLYHLIQNFQKVDTSELFSAFYNSIKLSLSCLVLVLPLALAGTYVQRHNSQFRTAFSSLMLLPLFIPVMLLIAALSTSFSQLIEFFRDSYWTVAAIQAIVTLPLVSRILSDGYQSISEELEKSALSLGASPFQVFTRIELPLLSRFILLGSAVAVCFSLGEVSSLLLFGSSQGPTLSLLVFQKLGRYAVTEATVLGGILMLLMALIIYGAEKCKLS